MKKMTLNQALQKANAAYTDGKLEVAERLLAKILQIEPNNADANHNMGHILAKSGNVTEAIPYFKTALEANFSVSQYWFSFSNALFKVGRYNESAELLAIARTKGCHGEAFDDLETELNSEEIELRRRIERLQEADIDETVSHLKFFGIGEAWQKLGKLEEAIEAYNKSLAIKPDYAEAYNNMGVTLQEQGKLEEAIEACNKALAIKPDYAAAYNNMGNALKDQGKLEEAIETYNKALAIKPDYAEAYYNMGNTLKDQGKLEEAIEAYNKSLAIKPDYAEAHHNMSYACLAVKNFEQGFEKHEWRWKNKQFKTRYLKTKKPTWSGETRQRVLVSAEQGIGDEIMYSSIIPEIYATSSKILVKCDKRLIPLFERSFSDDITYYSRDANVSEDEYDFHIPMGSLPLTFRKSLDSFKNSASGFLKCNMARAESIKGQLLHEPGKKLVGISWKTKSPLRNSSTRNINLADLARALDNSKTQLVCLQYGDVSDEIAAVKRDFGINVVQFDKVDNKYDIDGLASLIGTCDMVVTIDNATAHLSGALGVRTKLMLPHIVDWRWSILDENSYWYDALKLFRQSKANDWHSVLAQIKAMIKMEYLEDEV